MKKFVCLVCGKEFESGSPQARYCTFTCQRRAKAQRRYARENKEHPPEIDTRFFATVKDPSIAQLDKYGELVSLDLTQDKPIRLLGLVPMWTPPSKVQVVEQQGIEPKEWIMVKKETSIFDLLKT